MWLEHCGPGLVGPQAMGALGEGAPRPLLRHENAGARCCPRPQQAGWGGVHAAVRDVRGLETKAVPGGPAGAGPLCSVAWACCSPRMSHGCLGAPLGPTRCRGPDGERLGCCSLRRSRGGAAALCCSHRVASALGTRVSPKSHLWPACLADRSRGRSWHVPVSGRRVWGHAVPATPYACVCTHVRACDRVLTGAGALAIVTGPTLSLSAMSPNSHGPDGHLDGSAVPVPR